MTPEAYRAALSRVGLTQVGAARFFDVGERTSRRWASEGAPRAVELVLLLMERFDLKAADVSPSPPVVTSA